MKMEAAGSSETLIIFYMLTWRHIQEDRNLLFAPKRASRLTKAVASWFQFLSYIRWKSMFICLKMSCIFYGGDLSDCYALTVRCYDLKFQCLNFHRRETPKPRKHLVPSWSWCSSSFVVGHSLPPVTRPALHIYDTLCLLYRNNKATLKLLPFSPT
jgi:hypothetical protein